MPIKSCSFTAQYESLAGRILAKQQVFAFASFSRSKVCLRFSMIGKPKNQSCVFPKLVCLESILEFAVSLVSFKTCRVPNFRLRWKLFFCPEEFQSVFQNKQKLNLRLQFFVKNLFVGRNITFFSALRWAKTLWVKKSTNLTVFLQKIFSMKSVEFSQFSCRWLSDCMDPYQLSWLPQ